MSKTSTRVSFNLYEFGNKQDIATLQVLNAQTFVAADDLETGNVVGRPYATYEPDFWLLDGGYKFIPASDPHSGYISLPMSDAVTRTFPGDDGDSPRVIITFNTPRTMDGLTLYFSAYSGDYMDSVWVRVFDPDNNSLLDTTYNPTGTEYTITAMLENVKTVNLTLSRTSRPQRYARLSRIDFGVPVEFTGTAIKSCKIIEDTDPLSAELRINAMSLTLYSANQDFNMLNPAGSYTALKKWQPLAVYETIDNYSFLMGVYFLKEWKNTSNTDIHFECVDYIGLMDETPYYGDMLTGAGVLSQTLIGEILGAVGIPFELDVALYDIPVLGWIPAGTVREAIQQIAFAIGAAVDCSRSYTVRFYQSPLAQTGTATATITKAVKGASQSLDLQPAFPGIRVTAHTIVESDETLELFNGSLDAGVHEISFSQPVHNLSCTGGNIIASTVNYAMIEVLTTGTVVLTGLEYIDYQRTYKIVNPDDVSSVSMLPEVKDATLVTPANVAAVAQRIYDYRTQRYKQQLRLYAPTVTIGQVVTVETLYNRQIRAVIETMEIEPTRGMVSDCVLVGVDA